MKKLLIYFIFFSLAISAQQTQTDSLRTVLNATRVDSSKVQLLHEIYMITDSVNYSMQGLELAKKINYKKGVALSLLDIGRHYYFDGKGDLALSYLIQAIKIAEENGQKKLLVSAFRYVGFVYRPHDPFTAEDYYKKSLKIAEEIKDEMSASYALSAIGNIYEGIYEGASANNKKALGYYLRSLEIREKKGSYAEIASSLNETSRMYDLLGEYDKGLKLRHRGLEIAEKSESTENIIYLCNVLGNDYSLRLHEYKKGLEYQLRAFTIAETQKNNFEVRYDIAKGIAYSYYSLGDFKRSNDYYQRCIILNDSIKGRRNAYDYNLSGIKHGLEKELEKQKSLLMQAEIQKGKAEAARQTILRNAFLIGFSLVLILAIIIFRGYRQKQRSHRELDLKNKKIEVAYKTLAISEKNFKQITETITDVFYLYNILEKKYEYVSPNCEAMLGLSTAYFYEGKSTKAIVFKDDLPLVIEANVKIDAGISYDIEYRILVNEQIKWIAEKSSPIFENGILVRNSGICRDITQRKNDQELLY
ncbi:MAG: PAS domain-containing protein, partial [Bacteroidia bacterium]|nr:PAS domain-containing protein [Bacteroidia bacterium]